MAETCTGQARHVSATSQPRVTVDMTCINQEVKGSVLQRGEGVTVVDKVRFDHPGICLGSPIQIWYDILIQCHGKSGIYKAVTIFNLMLTMDILSNSSQINLGSSEGYF